jgi:8-oxo-dGTP diphosphatase
MEKLPKVGMGVMIFKGDRVLMQRRRNSHGDGEYAFPGGHLEFGESFVHCVKRETLEEAGIKIKNIKFLYLANLTKYPGKHYVQVGMIANWQSGKPEHIEKDKGEEWGWYKLNKLPRPFFKTVKWYLKAHQTGQNFFN